MNILNKLKKNKEGFTLIELMVATSLFTIVMLMGVGALVTSSNSSKSAQKLRIAVDNVNLAMETMTRELRTGTHFYCGGNMTPYFVGDCPAGTFGDIITFNPQQVGVNPPSRVGYYLKKRVVNGVDQGTFTLQRCEVFATNCSDIVSSNVNVTKLKFYVKGSELPPTDTIQPSVEILMNGVVKIKGKEVPFTLQSMATQRSSE
ncbi:MAG: hypothetical protein UR85_C0004G0034 [Candidatus Nomurabacteria bacterium GW2011_GWF2_35_66]|uniref:Uncharacterized protein n=1 Tax=Candidatus Nomurabacteria bacterium GW2011_GWE1_35_16 TaxID=1618761 RepID=A0A0G0BBS5_9BACT|nr:MAG: hypothetical protein UR55_C0002G0033 [Candidatus Nomurabacteria bacterium GW2011_GWF1_34_20]KKP63612.1 MAG: hypothetical protein UR57_C0002G0033 [Candidatus Nomurabacteria bacterium GW2011_GWE2_34_25]KKP66814.1 MAG: hypothetical protein UR64_C0002G0030 [Candidatus Nomurabacteria bacterium GW2011_GWE1_35_16]KKP83440.1 MAG: hypothetical protein UR85_C0004G0034 [Candidatus Nomurabacteria bacterium GW2011_GWF2_35_66]HAE36628.1 hypothetical protein [Candidatus Nomurabacteria bacterium]